MTEIGNQIQYEEDNTIVGKIFVIVSILISIICICVLFFGNPKEPKTYIFNIVGWGIMAAVGFFTPHKDDIILVNGEKFIRLFRNKPNQESVLKFIDNLIELSNIKKREIAINFDLTEEHFMANILWLQSNKLIDSKEAEELKAEYNLKKLL